MSKWAPSAKGTRVTPCKQAYATVNMQTNHMYDCSAWILFIVASWNPKFNLDISSKGCRCCYARTPSYQLIFLGWCHIDVMVQFCWEINTAEEFQLSVAVKVKLFIVDFTTLAAITVITTTALSCIHGLDEDLKESFLLCLHSRQKSGSLFFKQSWNEKCHFNPFRSPSLQYCASSSTFNGVAHFMSCFWGPGLLITVQKHTFITLFTDLVETGLHFMVTMFSGFPSNLLWLLCVNPSLIYRASWLTDGFTCCCSSRCNIGYCSNKENHLPLQLAFKTLDVWSPSF